ncbi:MAG: class I SAM-dependent methyltransferase [Bacteroidales bacterium]
MNSENIHNTSSIEQKQNINCRICGNGNGNKLFTARERCFHTLEEFPYFICSDCGCIQILEFPENPEKYYPAEYYSFEEPKFPTELNWFNSFLKKSLIKYYMGYFDITGFFLSLIFEHPFPWIRKREINFDSRILDVGCGAGRKLLSLYRSGFRNLSGIDPYIEEDIIYPEGVVIKKTELSEVTGEYDFVMLHHSFEHMPDPLKVMHHIKRLLTDNGTVLIRIPVGDSLAWKKYGEYWSGLDAPRHFYIHTIKSIRILAEKSGLSVEHIGYDSTRDQFVTSEKYLRGLPKSAPDSLFSEKDLRKFDLEAKRLNKKREGDWACFHLKKKHEQENE